ncbi:MAG: TetR/AcrR family transcriptional regulator [Acidimicrobiia bacterium]
MTGLRERKKQQTADRLVDAAGALFTRKGFAATTMEEIAAAAEVSVGTLYNYYGTKNTILLAHIGARVATMMDDGAAVLANPPGEPAVAVQTLTAAYLDGFLSLERELLREAFAAGFSQVSDVLPELIRLDKLLIDQMGGLLEPYAASGRLRFEVSEAVVLLYSILATQLIMYASVDEVAPASVRRSVAAQIEIAFSGLRAQER